MRSANHIVEEGGIVRFCLAEEGHHYLVYSQKGRIDIRLKGDKLKGRWFNPRNPEAELGAAFDVTSEILEPREGSDTITFVADTPGVFTFYCGLPYNPDKLYCDPDHNMMTGTLIVLE